jgi:hypothetical protein
LSKFDISNNDLCAAGTKALAEGLKGNQRMTELNMSSNDMGVSCCWGPSDMSGLITLADGISGMGAMTSLDISSNHIGQLVRPDGWQLKKGGIFSASKWVHLDGRTQKDEPLEPVDVIAIASAITNMGAMTKLNLSKNRIRGAEAGKALGDAIAGNTVLKELDISGDEYNKCDVEFVKAIAVGLHDNGALLSLDMSDNDLGCQEAGQALGDMLATNSTLQQLNLSNNFIALGTALAENKDRPAKFAQALSVGLRDNGAISLVDLSSNGIGRDGALAICNAFLCRYCALWYWGA